MSNIKTQSRERAMLLLFEADSKEKPVSEILSTLDVEPEKYAFEILKAYEADSEKINDLISTYSKGWAKDRMPGIDRAVLRMAITELVRSAEIPVGTIISEAIALCEQYSTPDSPKYVNGVLGTVAHNVRGVDLLKSKKNNEKETSTQPGTD